MMNITFTSPDFEKLASNISIQPRISRDEIAKFIVRAKAEIQRIYMNTPWKVGSSGGGVPKATGNLMRKGTDIEVSDDSITFSVSDRVKYGKYVHGRDFGETNKRNGVESRPWLYHAGEKAQSEIEQLQRDLIDKLVNNIIK